MSINLYDQLELYDAACKAEEFRKTARTDFYRTEKETTVEGFRIKRAEKVYVIDGMNYIYEIGDSCLPNIGDAQIAAVCFGCEESAYTKYELKQRKLVGFTKEHRFLFRSKVEKQLEELDAKLKRTPKKARARRYIKLMGKNLEDLSMIDNKVVLLDLGEKSPYSDHRIHYMTGILKRTDEAGEPIHVVIEVNDFVDDFLIKSGILEAGQKPKPIITSKNPMHVADETANQLEDIMIEGLKVMAST